MPRIAGPPALAALMLLALANCSTRVTNTSGQARLSSTPLPPPQRVVVLDFTGDQARMRLDQGIGPRLQRAMRGGDASADMQVMQADVRNAIAEALVSDIRKMGLPAERAAVAPPPEVDTVVVQGQIRTIDQGNRTRRLGIGFGAGKSDVSAQVQVYYQRPGQPGQLLQTYDADSNSGRKPGMAFGGAMAASRGSIAPALLTGGTGVVSETRKSDVAKEGERLGGRLAHEMGEYFVRQGWIQPSAVPALSLR